MSAEGTSRGQQLLKGGKRIGTGPSFFARAFAGGFQKLIGRFDRGLAAGSLLVTLPDGTIRKLGGRAPGFDAQLTLHSWRALWGLATGGSVACYQAWEAGELESADLVCFFSLFMANGESLGDAGRAKGPWRFAMRMLHRLNRNTREQARRNIHAHYNLGNDFYSLWLDPTMSYSSALAIDGGDLEDAQRRKWARLAERLGNPSTLLEIGCGWGSLANFFAERGSAVTGISLSDEQLDWAREHHCEEINFQHQDYRDTEGQFDAIVSVEMVEAVGREYWPTFFDCLSRCLKPGGRAAIQFIAIGEEVFDNYARNADFIQTYIFPGGLLIRTSEFQRLAAERGLSWEDQEDFALDYAETLRIWRESFELAANEGRLPAGFDERFVRLWRFYLMYCEGGFRGGGITVTQVTLCKD